MSQSKALTIDQVITSKDDPTKLFDLLEELAVGSYGHVYKVRRLFSCFVLSVLFVFARMGF